MRLTGRPALRSLIAGLLATTVLLLFEFAPLHLVAYGQTAGPLPAAPQPPAFLPPPAATAIAAGVPSNCTVLTGKVSAAGGSIAVQCSGGGALAIAVPPGAVDGTGILSLMTIGDVLGATSDCSGPNQLSILANQHFQMDWNIPGQPPRTDLNRPADVELPVAAAILAQAGGNLARLLILHALPDGSVTSIPATFSSDGTTAAFQSSRLGDFFVVALPPGLPTAYSGKVGAVDTVSHHFVFTSQNGLITVQSSDLSGGTLIVHADGSLAGFGEIPEAGPVRVDGLAYAASCGKPNTVVAVQIILGDGSGTVAQPQDSAIVPRYLPATGLGGLGG